MPAELLASANKREAELSAQDWEDIGWLIRLGVARAREGPLGRRYPIVVGIELYKIIVSIRFHFGHDTPEPRTDQEIGQLIQQHMEALGYPGWGMTRPLAPIEAPYREVEDEAYEDHFSLSLQGRLINENMGPDSELLEECYRRSMLLRGSRGSSSSKAHAAGHVPTDSQLEARFLSIQARAGDKAMGAAAFRGAAGPDSEGRREETSSASSPQSGIGLPGAEQDDEDDEDDSDDEDEDEDEGKHGGMASSSSSSSAVAGVDAFLRALRGRYGAAAARAAKPLGAPAMPARAPAPGGAAPHSSTPIV